MLVYLREEPSLRETTTARGRPAAAHLRAPDQAPDPAADRAGRPAASAEARIRTLHALRPWGLLRGRGLGGAAHNPAPGAALGLIPGPRRTMTRAALVDSAAHDRKDP